MSALRSDRTRVIVYVFASRYLVGEIERALRADLLSLCAHAGLHLVETIVDRGPPKQRASDYPALGRIKRGQADGVLVVRSPAYERGRAADRLERLCPEGATGWLSAEALQQAGLLPRRRRSVTRRPADQAPALPSSATASS